MQKAVALIRTKLALVNVNWMRKSCFFSWGESSFQTASRELFAPDWGSLCAPREREQQWLQVWRAEGGQRDHGFSCSFIIHCSLSELDFYWLSCWNVSRVRIIFMNLMSSGIQSHFNLNVPYHCPVSLGFPSMSDLFLQIEALRTFWCFFRT